MEIQINIDCSDPDALRAFYCAALGYEPRGQMGSYRSCVPPVGVVGNTVVFQQVPESKVAKNRVHLDLIVDDIEAEAARWVGLGATRVSEQRWRGRRLLDRDARPRRQRDLPLRQLVPDFPGLGA